MQIEMSGKEDRQGPWKFAIAGMAGSGKTIVSSTAPNPLFVFFQNEPRIKSVADRSIQYVKIVNDFSNQSYAIDQMNALLLHLQLQDHDFETLVIDTGDEFFQQMKAGRTYQNGGEFGPGDWGWIADAYREVMLGLIDLPMNVIATYHTKSTQDEDHTFKELMLQGQAKDEACSWFDIVGALDTYQIVDEHGETVTKRVFLTSSSRVYPWVKDHSGALPSRFELSSHITDDIPRMLALASAEVGESSHEVVGEIAKVVDAPTVGSNVVPSPEELDAKKKEVPEPSPQDVAPIDTTDTKAPGGIATAETGDLNKGEAAQAPSDPEPTDSQQQVESAAAPPVNIPTDSKPIHEMEEAVATVKDVLDAEDIYTCVYEADGTVCGEVVEDDDLRDLTQIRFREYLCRPHFKKKLLAE